MAYPLVQPLPNDEVLVVGARCRRFRDGSAERNAAVYGPDGEVQREFTLGDGIEDVQTTHVGEIWVSYFDEGVVGNYGWGNQPIGRSGIVRFGADGAKEWDYFPPLGAGSITDCYALNADGGAAWAYTYPEFPLVRIAPNGSGRAWDTNLTGARAFAVDGRRILLFGGYGARRDRCVLADLGPAALEHAVECQLLLPDGALVTRERGHVVGRGPMLHVFTRDAWYQLDLQDLR